MYVTYDSEVDFAYIGLTSSKAGGAAHTLMLDEWAAASGMDTLHDLTLDFDEGGRLVGIEVANARKVLPPQLIEQASGSSS